MLVSILHRVTGSALAIAGLAVLTWWLIAIAGTPADYDFFQGFIAVLTGRTFGQAETALQWIVNVLAVLIGVGLSWSFFQHLLSGMRHLVMDTGAGFELTTNKRFAILTIVGSILLTALLWVWLLGVRP